MSVTRSLLPILIVEGVGLTKGGLLSIQVILGTKDLLTYQFCVNSAEDIFRVLAQTGNASNF
jgi:hypothetical protein